MNQKETDLTKINSHLDKDIESNDFATSNTENKKSGIIVLI
jgi:hypothetical protein